MRAAPWVGVVMMSCYLCEGKLLSSPEQLAMNQGDGFRNIQEER